MQSMSENDFECLASTGGGKSPKEANSFEVLPYSCLRLQRVLTTELS